MAGLLTTLLATCSSSSPIHQPSLQTEVTISQLLATPLTVPPIRYYNSYRTLAAIVSINQLLLRKVIAQRSSNTEVSC
ncbi:hypothetical protein BDQ12DRAFT_691881 [Crucibulum laeve]|uniref:Uncharacterized protein n=1 Tax=Crucibulum laeve TaxID=68775 RepID=A0A5C3LJK1_9AGAR|nr:hypothetical protein BDQ12DRAFT_691881 [Crucibulum laeve]